MAKLMTISVLAVLGAIAVLAALASAQTPPPPTGDWVVTDYTEYSDTSITVNGSINVTGVLGRLSLTNVTLVINHTTGGDAIIESQPNSGGLDFEGCDISATDDLYGVKLTFNSILRDSVLRNASYVDVAEDYVTVANCTIYDPRDNAIYIDPYLESWKVGRIFVTGNRIFGGYVGISVTISSPPAMDIALWVTDNVIVGTTGDGVFTYLDASGDLYLNRTRVTKAGSNGMELMASGIRLHLDGVVVEDSSYYGIDLMTNFEPLPSGMVLSDVTLHDNVVGARLYGAFGDLDRFTLHGWTVTGSKATSLELVGAFCMTIEESIIYTTATSYPDISLKTSSVDLYNTNIDSTQIIIDASSRIHSWVRFQLRASWQTGLPCAYKMVDALDWKGDKVLGPERTNASGSLIARYIWNWYLKGFSSAGSHEKIVPRLVEGPSPIEASGAPFDLIGDFFQDVTFVDDIVPALQVLSPTAGHGQNTTSLVVSGTADDPLSGLAVVQVSLDGAADWDLKAWDNATGLATWQFPLEDLAEGTHTIYVRAFDAASWPDGAFAQAAVGGIVVDLTAPRITVTAPSDGFRTREPSVIVRGTVDADTVELTVGGASAVHTLGAFVTSVPIVEGPNAIAVTARDGVGNWGSNYIRVERDTVAPALSIASPMEGDRTNRTRLLVAGTTEAGASVTVQGQAATVIATSWEATVTLVDGTNALAVEAVDDVGNRATRGVTVVLDRTPPSITVDMPTEGEVFNTSYIYLYAFVYEEDILVRVALDDHEYLPAPIVGVGVAINAEPMGPLPEGLAEIRILAIDLAGNVEVVVVHVTIDTVAPALTGLAPANGTATNDPRLPLSGATEPGASLSVEGRLVPLSDGAFTVPLELREGWNDVVLVVSDGAGNRNATSMRFLLDTIAPQLVLDNVGPDLMVTVDGRTHNLTGRTEPLARVVLEVAGSSLELAVGPDGSFSHIIDLGSRGKVTVNLTATDAVGNPTMLSVRMDRRVVAPAWTDSPAVVGGTATAAVLVVLVVAGSVETTKYSLLVLLAPLYARIAKGEVLDNRTRYALHGLIIENPGLHYNAIIREFGLTNGEAAYHLSVLEREGFIRSIRDGTLRKFYSTTTKVPREHRATPEEMRDRIMDLVDGLPGISQKQIVDELGIGRTLAGYHLGCLVTEGFVEARRDGRFTVYYPTRKRREGHARPVAPLDGARADGGPGMQQ